MNPDRRAEIEASRRGLYLNQQKQQEKDHPEGKESSSEELFSEGARWILTGSVADHDKLNALVKALTKLYQECLKVARTE